MILSQAETPANHKRENIAVVFYKRMIPRENYPRSRSPQALVSCRRDDVAVREGVGRFPRSDQARDVRHVGH